MCETPLVSLVKYRLLGLSLRGLKVHQRICISNKCSADTHASDQGLHFENQWSTLPHWSLRIICNTQLQAIIRTFFNLNIEEDYPYVLYTD